MTDQQNAKSNRNLSAYVHYLWQWVKGLGWWRVTLIIFGLVAIHFIREQRQKQIDAELMARVSFATMWDRLDEIQSVQYTEIHSYPNRPNRESVRHEVAIMGEHLWRRESRHIRSLLQTARSMKNGGHGYGIGSERWTSIVNDVTGKSVTMYPDEKRYVENTWVAKDQVGEVVPKKQMKPNLGENLKQFQLEMQFREAKQIGVETIGGRRAVGFVAEGYWAVGYDEDGNWSFSFDPDEERENKFYRREEYWIDPDSQLPILIDISLYPQIGTKDKAQRWLYTDLVFDDPNLDKSLFDTTPPPGYKTEKRVIETVVDTPLLQTNESVPGKVKAKALK